MFAFVPFAPSRRTHANRSVAAHESLRRSADGPEPLNRGGYIVVHAQVYITRFHRVVLLNQSVGCIRMPPRVLTLHERMYYSGYVFRCASERVLWFLVRANTERAAPRFHHIGRLSGRIASSSTPVVRIVSPPHVRFAIELPYIANAPFCSVLCSAPLAFVCARLYLSVRCTACRVLVLLTDDVDDIFRQKRATTTLLRRRRCPSLLFATSILWSVRVRTEGTHNFHNHIVIIVCSQASCQRHSANKLE